MKPLHYETLTTETKKVWDSCDFPGDWYLAGGTALALQIGHRVSIDLDFFSDTPIAKNLLPKIEEHFGVAKTQVIIKTTNELTMLIDGVKVTFLHYPFDLLYSKLEGKPKPLASIVDIASMKAYTLGRRQSLKDYVDLYFIIKGDYLSLREIIIDAERKYDQAFSDRLFCEQLLYTDDLEDEPIEWIGQKISVEDIKNYFGGQIAEYLNN